VSFQSHEAESLAQFCASIRILTSITTRFCTARHFDCLLCVPMGHVPLRYIIESTRQSDNLAQPAVMVIASSPEESARRLGEIAEILAAGLMRLRARKSSGLLPGEQDFSLETLARQSGAVAQIEGDTQ
jgi:hypothetical protein